MAQIYDIARNLNLSDNDQVSEAMAEIETASYAELHHVIIISESAQSNEWRKTGALARSEIERRNAVAAEELAMKTTKYSARMGIIGVAVGAVLGSILTFVATSAASVEIPTRSVSDKSN